MIFRFPVVLVLYLILFSTAAFAWEGGAPANNTVILKAGSKVTLRAANSDAAAYQWFKNGQAIDQAIYKEYITGAAGVYTVIGYNKESCPSAASDPIEVKLATGKLIDLWITADNKVKTYGTDNPPFTLKFDGFVNGDDQSVLQAQPVAATSASAQSAAGVYPISVNGAMSDKYAIHYTSGSLSVEKAHLLVTAESDTVLATGQPYDNQNGVIYTGFVNGDTPESLKGALVIGGNGIGAVNPGKYELIPSGYQSDNYNISYMSGSLEILEAPVDVSVQTFAENKTVGIGESFEYFIKAGNKRANATGVTVTDILPAEVELVSQSIIASAGTTSYDNSNHHLVWTIGNFAAGADAELQIMVKAIKSGEAKNLAKITSAEKDVDPSNNSSTDEKNINSVKIPNIFTPNNDGINDAFVIPGLLSYPDNELNIFNRGGGSVYQKRSYQNDWVAPGLADGTYFYVLKVKITGDQYETYKGYVTVLRSSVTTANL